MSENLSYDVDPNEPNPAEKSTPERTEPCEVCTEPVAEGERWAILRDTGEVWRHSWHTETV